ncbi:hypothetical protein HN789_00920 [archaeon]|jgi:hypothetical protein|nr:hypothetical protein [archaeon]MBT4022090.1 hypothetical protein [archaeon]MBT4272703.1 hypothetical protein [archaeon]MBT4461502.1 hypothetical protein [archaeon]MBT4857729.1 hypothetical protein [archaeon]
MMTKKSQIYFFAAIILVGMVFFVVSNQPSLTAKDTSQVKKYFDNYKYEAKIVLDNAIYQKKNISYELKNYTERFIAYGDSKNLDLRILFIYSYENELHIVNYLKEPVLINTIGSNIENGQEVVLAVNTSQITYSNKTYTYQFNPDLIEFKALFVKGD